jgi:hypothetical protein
MAWLPSPSSLLAGGGGGCLAEWAGCVRVCACACVLVLVLVLVLRESACSPCGGGWLAGGSTGCVSTSDGEVYFLNWASGEHFLLTD